jgi:hypothetical protein
MTEQGTGCFLFTESPRRGVLGNRYSYARIAYSRRGQMQVNFLLTDLPRRHQPPVAGCGEVPYACSARFLEEFFRNPGFRYWGGFSETRRRG